ncbi:MAG TPA: DEAD/DEAH box helicase [Polyangiaceae bacterium]|jgi:DNA repair protein RadD|nr:DEAD/DEAH box helicase [Polyangiaceae bacterium]
MIELRDYQADLVARVGEAYRAGARSVVMQAGTGSGKTTTASALIARAIARRRNVIFAAHLDSLIDDTSDRLSVAGIEHGIVQADRPTNPTAPVQVCSLATLHRRGERPPADFVIVDECHRAMAASVREVLSAYPLAWILGLTATPERGDGAPLGDVFERMVCGPSVAELTARGHLVPAVVLAPPAPFDGGLACDPVDAYELHVPGQPAMVFCRDADHARDVAARMGERAALILGDTPRDARRRSRERLAAGEPLVLVGCGVFVEGWDSPEVRAVIMGRAFGNVGGFLQGCGRALRPARGKTHATIIDLSGAALLHGLPQDDRVWSLDGPPRRTGAGLKPLARCRECLAVFHAGPPACPRCGASTKSTGLPRRATRVERQELARLDTRPQAERDAIALRGIEKRLRSSGRFPEWRIATIARSIFERTKKRSAPEAA